jgi:perosamine synthetase
MSGLLDRLSASVSTAEAHAAAPDIARYVCRDDDVIWVGIEKCIDNGHGCVFVTSADGIVIGRADMEGLRAAIAKGVHLADTRMSDVARPMSANEQAGAVSPITDAKRRIVSVSIDHTQNFLPVAEPDLTHREFRNLMDAFLSTWISSTGDYIRTFEQRFATATGVAHGVATSNGTTSLHLALAALGIGEGDEVIVPDFTFAASANTVLHVGARPVLVDIDPHTWCISPDVIARAITSRTRAIMPVHVFGRPAPMTEIAALARSHGLFIIEDCAEAHGAAYDGQPVGSFSDVASFSFYANKIITTGEGGICVTNDTNLAARMRMLRDHGMRPDRRYWHEEAGFNFRMTNLQASIGCAQLDRMPELLAMRRAVHESYKAAFKGIDSVLMPNHLGERSQEVVWFSCARVPASKRQALIDACKAANIDLRPFFNSLSAMPAYRRYARHCPHSAALSLDGVNLPTSRRVTPEVVDRIAEIFRTVLTGQG